MLLANLPVVARCIMGKRHRAKYPIGTTIGPVYSGVHGTVICHSFSRLLAALP
jgi:hypothetical protein